MAAYSHNGDPGSALDRDIRGVSCASCRLLRKAHADALEKLKVEEKALKHQRTALMLVRDRQRCNVSEADLTLGITQIDAPLAAIREKP